MHSYINLSFFFFFFFFFFDLSCYFYFCILSFILGKNIDKIKI